MPGQRAGEPLVHAGPRQAERVVAVPTTISVRHAELSPGSVLTDELWSVVADAGCAAASIQLCAGTLGALSYVHPAIDHSGQRQATFSDTIAVTEPAFLSSGSATLGLRDGDRFAHLHASWRGSDGQLRGGHLLPGATVGAVPVHAVVRALHEVNQYSETDLETGLPAFTPARRPADALGQRRGVISRVRPGVDLHEAVLFACRKGEFASATICASLGSVVGARLRTGAGRVVEADWPATEFTELTGTVRYAETGSPEVILAGTAVDRNGDVHSGLLIPGQNPVAVTFELYLEEAAADGG
ncbi:putative DNA-binding protein with PD1-like motif [Tamaricihabitans halophyticus]|uniref:Putative DNA-binding protein with PD1-like motif n=1 Tax=Tamaricihabitans halophyticus TaxID=1262583 RepID=A0A4R2R288_9PSEU|nr:DUF296 domain-containing protein [Tamaricihabitans halophyticus]TCP53545.1 putative DNA-binding protein with PD1-like motif [Tamaricihabitans halophyticus]